MSYIIMAIQEEGSEIRINDFDEHERGFDQREEACRFVVKAKRMYPEFRNFWVEELKDQQYWVERLYEYEDYEADSNEW